MDSCVYSKKKGLPKLSSLESYPSVAILHLTCDDFIPPLATRLQRQTYPNLEIFILDDSIQIDYHHKIDSCGLPVVRRKSRVNFKAGNINNWLQHYSCHFDYFIILDNDSVIPNNFVEEMVKYGEHEANLDIAVFQSSVGIWNQNNRFARTLDLVRSLRTFVSERIDNPCETLLPTTNMLVRTSVIQSIGGFATGSCTEDWETGLKVIEQGFRCQRVDVNSYVSMSTNVQIHTQRMVRWASGIVEITKAGIRNVPLTTNLRLFMGIYHYMIWPIYIAGLVLAIIWGNRSDWGDLWGFPRTIWFSCQFENNPILLLTSFLSLYFAHILVLRPFLMYRMGISLRDYIGHVLITSAVGFYAFAPLLTAQFAVLLGKHSNWGTLRLDSSSSTILTLLKEMRLQLFVLGIMLAGLIKNPVFVVLNSFWLILLFISPFVLYYWQSPDVQDWGSPEKVDTKKSKMGNRV